jgi:hypothetical protein
MRLVVSRTPRVHDVQLDQQHQSVTRSRVMKVAGLRQKR